IVNFDSITKADILIENTKIKRIAQKIEGKEKTINADGKFIFPGIIDLHAHLRIPGDGQAEDLLSGSKAAAKGGITTLFCMPNTTPSVDNEGLVKWIIEESEKINIAKIIPIAAITKDREGKTLTEYNALKNAGCLAVSDDGCSVADSLIFRRALEYAKMTGLLVISHCEDPSLSAGGAMREGFISSKYGISAIASISESIIVYRDVAIAQYLDVPIHIAHISTKNSLEIIRKAKKEGASVTAETCPHYFSFTTEDIEKHKFDSNFKVNPPLGDMEDIKEIKKALKDGTIDCIATDHAPHSYASKEQPFETAPFGFIGFETLFSSSYTALVKGNILTLEQLSEKLSYNPAKITGLKGYGEIKEGNFADLIIVDLEKKWSPSQENIVSKSKNTPFLGKELQGVVEYTINNGNIVFENEDIR
ncbi:MAG: dihydroorotase, partial [Candidatus Omnitrophica bacterium]|nr:dihydroorotase [Candidatus Omnitrophota bacterium]